MCASTCRCTTPCLAQEKGGEAFLTNCGKSTLILLLGFERIDHVVLKRATGTLKSDETAFVVRGALNEATNCVEAVQHEAQAQACHAAHRMTV